MCGVAGTIGIHPDVAVPAASRMLALRHRGPDGEGIEVIEVPVYQSFSCMLGSRSSTSLRPAGSRCSLRFEENAPQSWITYNGRFILPRTSGRPGTARADPEERQRHRGHDARLSAMGRGSR